jgi:hypothetical protein
MNEKRSAMNNQMNSENQDNEKDQGVWLHHMIIAAFGVTVIAIMIGAILLVTTGGSSPDAVVALGAAAIGGMAGFLVHTQLNR